MSFLLGAGVVLLVLFIGIIATRIVSVLVLLFLGILLAESIRPIANKLQTWKIPRGVAVMIVYLLLALVLTGVGLILIPPLVVQMRGFDNLTEQLIDWVREEVPRLYQITVDLGFEDQLADLGTSLTSTVTQLIGTLAQVPFQVLGFLFGLVSVLVIGFFWMSATDRFNHSVIALLPPKSAACRDPQPRLRTITTCRWLGARPDHSHGLRRHGDVHWPLCVGRYPIRSLLPRGPVSWKSFPSSGRFLEPYRPFSWRLPSNPPGLRWQRQSCT